MAIDYKALFENGPGESDSGPIDYRGLFESGPTSSSPYDRPLSGSTSEGEPSFLDELIINPAKRGLNRFEQSVDYLTGDAAGVAENEKDLRALGDSQRMAALQEEVKNSDGWWGATKAFASNPGAVVELTVESLAQQLPTIFGSIGAGAAAGSVAGPVAGVAGAAGGTALGSFTTEYTSTVLDGGRQAGYDLTKPDQVEAFFADEPLMEQLRKTAFERGVPIAAFDALSMGIAGRVYKPVAKALTSAPRRAAEEAAQAVGKVGPGLSAGGRVAGGAAEIGMQGALGGAGEVGAALNSGQEVDRFNVLAEVFGELLPGGVESLGGYGLSQTKKGEGNAATEDPAAVQQTVEDRLRSAIATPYQENIASAAEQARRSVAASGGDAFAQEAAATAALGEALSSAPGRAEVDSAVSNLAQPVMEGINLRMQREEQQQATLQELDSDAEPEIAWAPRPVTLSLGTVPEAEAGQSAPSAIEEMSPDTGNTVQAVRSRLESSSLGAYLPLLDRAGVLNIVQTEAELPPEIQAAASAANSEEAGVVQGVTYRGKVWLVASQIDPGKEYGVLIHEGKHYSLERPEAAGVHRQVNSEFARLVREGDKHAVRAWERVQESEGNASPDVQRNEAVAYLVEEVLNDPANATPKAKLTVARVMRDVRLWFAQTKIGRTLAAHGIAFQLSPMDIVEIVRKGMIQSAYNDLTSGANVSDSAEAQFSRNPVDFPIANVRRANGAIGTQGVTEDQVRGVLTHAAGMEIPEDATMRQMVEGLKGDVPAQQRLRDFTRKNPIEVTRLPDDSYHLNDGHHRTFLLNQLGDETVPAKVKGEEPQFSRKTKRPVPDAVRQAASLEAAFKTVTGRTFDTNRELKLELQKAVLAAAKEAGVDLSSHTEEAKKYLVSALVEDAKYALKDNSGAIGWYDRTLKKAFRVLQTLHPELRTNSDARFGFIWALAVTSNGMKVDQNFILAERAYAAFKASGFERMPTDIGEGTAGPAINDGLRAFNDLSAELGKDVLHDLMVTEFTVAELQKALGFTIAGEKVDTKVRGAAILGPKIGNGFFSNLYGFFDALTMDRWLMRTWGRWTGTLIEIDPKRVKEKRAELAALRKVLFAKENKAALKEVKAILNVRTVNKQKVYTPAALPASIDKLGERIKKISIAKDVREKLNAVTVPGYRGPEGETLGVMLRRAGNNLALVLDGQKEAPANGSERNWIRKVFGAALAELQKTNPNLTMSDLQALIWYPEKRLYDSSKVDETAEGYEEEAAPDYANAAAKLARSKGISEQDIKEALDGRAEGAGQDSEDQTSAEQAGRRGFDQGEKEDFVRERFLGRQAREISEGKKVGKGKEDERTLAWEVVPGQNTPYAGLKDPNGELTKRLAPVVFEALRRFAGVAEAESSFSYGGWGPDISPNIMTNLKTTPEGAELLANIIGYLGGQDAVMVLREKAAGEDIAVTAIANEGTLDLDTLSKIWARVRAEYPAASGFSPAAKEGKKGFQIAFMKPEKRSSGALLKELESDLVPVLDRIAKDMGLDLDVEARRVEVSFLGTEWKEDPDGRGYLDRIAGTLGKARAEELRDYRRVVIEPLYREAAGVEGPRFSRAATKRVGSPRADLGISTESTPRYGSRREGEVESIGIHFSAQPRAALDSKKYGTGLRGAEAKRLRWAPDARLKSRTYFYVAEGTSIVPEAGVGEKAHRVVLTNLYDLKADPLGIRASNSMDPNAMETAILDAGFDGYVVPGAFIDRTEESQFGVAVVLGERSIPVEQVGDRVEPKFSRKARETKPLSEIQFTETVFVEGRGEVEIRRTAEQVLRQIDKKLDSAYSLLRCVS